MDTKQTIHNFLSTLAQRDISIGDDDSLLATKLLDSLKVVELIVFLESEYNVEFDSDDLTPDNLDTVNALVALLESKGVV